MLSTKHLYEEIHKLEEVCEKEKDVYKQGVLKAKILTLKLLHSIRTNTVQVMKHFKIETVKPREKSEETADE